MIHVRLALRYPMALLGACACFLATHHWACKGMARPHIRSEEL